MERTEEEKNKRLEAKKRAEFKEIREFYASSLHLNKQMNEKVEIRISRINKNGRT